MTRFRTSGARPEDWQKSWHFTVGRGGELFQHYPIELVTWHAGPKANPFYVGVEHEGVAGEVLEKAGVLPELEREGETAELDPESQERLEKIRDWVNELNLPDLGTGGASES